MCYSVKEKENEKQSPTGSTDLIKPVLVLCAWLAHEYLTLLSVNHAASRLVYTWFPFVFGVIFFHYPPDCSVLPFLSSNELPDVAVSRLRPSSLFSILSPTVTAFRVVLLLVPTAACVLVSDFNSWTRARENNITASRRCLRCAHVCRASRSNGMDSSIPAGAAQIS